MTTVTMKVNPEDLSRVPTGHERIPEPGILVIFGASGDLTKRKLLPALFHLEQAGLLPDNFSIVGVARRPLGGEFAADMREGIVEFGGVEANDPSGLTVTVPWLGPVATVVVSTSPAEKPPDTVACQAGWVAEVSSTVSCDGLESTLETLACTPRLCTRWSRLPTLAASSPTTTMRAAASAPSGTSKASLRLSGR